MSKEKPEKAPELKMIKEISIVPLNEIFPYPDNPREIDASQFEKLKESLMEFGLVDIFIVNIRNDPSFSKEEKRPTIVGGNMRYRAAKDNGFVEGPVGYIDIDKNREKILNIALNRISGKWDVSKLEKMVYELSATDLDLDLSISGLEDWELKLYNPAEDIDAEEIADIVGTDEKPTYVLKIVFSETEAFEKASKILGGDKRVRNIIRGEQLMSVLDIYEQHKPAETNKD